MRAVLLLIYYELITGSKSAQWL